jgi:inosine/xanthosine triphosphatase
MHVAVGSTNPAKIGAVRAAFGRVWPDTARRVEGCTAPSGVADQPMSDDEALRGARQRARHAMAAVGGDYAVGLEAGLQRVNQHWFNAGWVVVVDPAGIEGVASTLRMAVPETLMQLVREGRELGEACDMVFGGQGMKLAGGLFGAMTDLAIDRTGAFADAVIAALAPFLKPGL